MQRPVVTIQVPEKWIKRDYMNYLIHTLGKSEKDAQKALSKTTIDKILSNGTYLRDVKEHLGIGKDAPILGKNSYSLVIKLSE